MNSSSLINISESDSFVLGDKKKEKPWNSPKYLQAKKDNQNLEAYQQAILLALLNKHCSFVIEKAPKHSRVHANMPKVIALHFDSGEEFDIFSFSEKTCRNMYENELIKGTSQSTAHRRLEKNKKVFLQNLIFDITLEFGYVFNSNLSRMSGRTLRVERLDSVFYDGKLLLSKQQIIEKGSVINSFLCELSESPSPVVIQKDHPLLSRFLLPSIPVVC
ncbi:hypothetical protein QTN25_003711 [Entamoeba marina]